ncbi:MAG: tRNA-dihydrouridine synthase family protein [Lachnospiraceae bacterium]|nr:tRNA-dihydrouridine synthase family protein [Lachnospiraceae bacterium]
MRFYLAPMEGLTGYIFRNAYHTYFGNVDKYFSPFIAANQSDRLKTREIIDVLPENNQGLRLVPQLLTNHAKDFIHTSQKIRQMGYDEINLNLGCPSGTVVAKNKGAGFLAKREALDAFLEEVFTASVTKISIKTRIGIADPEEFYELLGIFNRYPIEELIIHPRVQKDFYKNQPNWAMFKESMSLSKNPVCYNGDIFTAEDYKKLRDAFPALEMVMLGRGLIVNPGLLGEIRQSARINKTLLRDFHDTIYEGYQKILFGDRNVLFKMKEIWFYLILLFTDHVKYAKKIKKSERLRDYEEAVTSLFKEQDIIGR